MDASLRAMKTQSPQRLEAAVCAGRIDGIAIGRLDTRKAGKGDLQGSDRFPARRFAPSDDGRPGSAAFGSASYTGDLGARGFLQSATQYNIARRVLGYHFFE
jgi:hypothetical protein